MVTRLSQSIFTGSNFIFGKRLTIYEMEEMRSLKRSKTANQYISFDSRTRRPSLYNTDFEGASGRILCFPFEVAHPLHSTHVQVSVGSVKALRTPSLCGSFTSMSKRDNSILDTTMTTWDEVHEVLLGLFYPCDKLCCDFQGQRPTLRASEYKISFGTCLFTLFLLT